MKAILQHEIGPAEALYIGEYDLPILKAGELLVQTHAFALNRADILQRKGKYPSPPGASSLMGLEVSGVVVDAGTSTRWKVGDAVFGLVPGGGYAEYTAVDEALIFSKPERVSFEEAAALPEVFLTAFLALVRMGRMQTGERVLIHGAAGGVGTAAIQIAKQMGCRVAATVVADKQQVCYDLGADLCIDYREGSWREQLEKEWGKSSVDVLLDVIGAQYFSDNLDVMAMDGRMTMLALIGGGDAAAVDLRKIIGKRLKIEGSTLRNRSLDFQRTLAAEMSAWMLPLLEKGQVRAIVDRVFPWQEVVQAHQRMEAGEHIGKIVMKID